MSLSLIAALACNGTIGRDGELPWHLPADLAHFKRKTENRVVVMGRRTYESIGRPLPRRRNIVLSRQAPPDTPGVEYFSSLPDVLAHLRDVNVVLIGGAAIYRAGLDLVSTMHLTVVHQRVQGDVCFPAFDERAWSVLEEVYRPPDENNALGMTFLTLVRREGHPTLTPLRGCFPQSYCDQLTEDSA